MTGTPTIAIVSPGAMGSALGRGWAEAGARVVASVAGRSARTRDLAHGLELVGSLDAAVAVADVVVSIVPPGVAPAVALAVRSAVDRSGGRPLVAELNAIAPATVRAIDHVLGDLDLVDGSISGGPPDHPGTRLYLSGPRAAQIADLRHPRLEVHVLPGVVGAASALKMSTASVYKGLAALFLQAAEAAEAAGVLDEMLADLAPRFPGQVGGLAPWLAMSVSKSGRYVDEMHEIATTQRAAGLSPELFEGIAAVWERVAGSPLARSAPEDAPTRTDARQVLRELRPPAP